MTNEETAKPLKPCPFCGSEPEIRPYSSQGIEIRCKKCLFKKQQKVLHKSVEWLEGKMIEDWNSRRDEKENAELRAAYREMRDALVAAYKVGYYTEIKKLLQKYPEL